MSEMYIEVTGIEWNEGPAYRGPKAFWFIIDEDTTDRFMMHVTMLI